MDATSPYKTLCLYLACLVLCIELGVLVYFFDELILWVEHHLWVVLLPFTKTIIKHLSVMKWLQVLQMISLLLWHCLKLGIMKLLKTVGLRYGLYFSQYRWRTIRWLKLGFLRKGRRFFFITERFWQGFNRYQQCLLITAFFPIVLAIFILSLSFNITRKTLVQKTQEAAMAKVATSASTQSHGLRAWIERSDRKIINRIKQHHQNKE